MNLFVVVISAVLVSGSIAMPTAQQSDGWGQSFTALRNWFNPVTHYVTNKLPSMTPAELANDVRDTAIDLSNQVQDHPLMQTLGEATRPVGHWVSNAANRVSQTTFADLYDSAVHTAHHADETVANWINSAPPLPKWEGIEADQELH